MTFLGLQSAGTQMLKAFTVHFVGFPKGKFGEYKNLFFKVSYRHQQQLAPWQSSDPEKSLQTPVF